MKLLTRLPRAETAYSHYVVDVEPDTPKEALSTDAYWQHVADMLRAGDMVEIRSTDSSYYMRWWLVGREKTGNGEWRMKWRQIEAVMFDGPAKVGDRTEQNVFVQWKVGRRHFEVLRREGSVNTVLADGFAKKDEAEAWMENYLTEAG